jgi:glycosyltransferase involved in cell wall biosynthesis
VSIITGLSFKHNPLTDNETSVFPMAPRISIIIVTRNRSALLARLLESLGRLRSSDWEAIVVDDGSTDDTGTVVRRFSGTGLPITYLHQPWRKMGAARNLALTHAKGEIAAFTDDDCVVDPDWVDAVARAFDLHPDSLGVQGKTVTNHAAMTPFTRQIEQLEGGRPYRTCNIAYRIEVLRELGDPSSQGNGREEAGRRSGRPLTNQGPGPFDEYLIRGEDVVMGERVLERGPIVFAPEAIVSHPPRPKDWADRRSWRTLLESELHFKRTYPQYLSARSPTLSLQKAEHVVSRWLFLPVRRYWRWHWSYFRRNPREYLRHVPLILREKLALLCELPSFLRQWSARRPR